LRSLRSLRATRAEEPLERTIGPDRPPIGVVALAMLVLTGVLVAIWTIAGRTGGESSADMLGAPALTTSTSAADGNATRAASRPEPPSAPVKGAALIQAENAKPGNPEWLISDGDVRPRPIQGFTDRVSAQKGDSVRLFVATRSPSFEVIAYRLGFYGGVGARQIWGSGAQVGVDQPECLLDGSTRMVDCSNWSPSLTVPIGPDWVHGQYLFKLIQADGSASFVPFVVRDDSATSDVLVIADVTTLQAYNTWGGYSLYTATGGRPGGRATVVSFDRPMDMYWAQSGTLGDSAEVGQMIESMGLDVTYTTNIDQHQHPELMRSHRAIVSGFHDEYYSLEMRNGLEAARDSGVNILFLGANAVYRRIRLEPSALGNDRHEVNYRSASADPLNGTDPERVTTAWREAPAARPESSITGTYYECNQGGMAADMVIVDGNAWMFAGANVADGQRWPDMVQEEYDRVTPSAPTPANIQVIAHSPLTCRGTPSHSDMAYYTAPSGAGVFNVGTLGFEPKLGPLCAIQDITPVNWECQLKQMTGTIIREFAKGPAGVTHPAQPNLDQLGIAP
jgi:hypothetical protein